MTNLEKQLEKTTEEYQSYLEDPDTDQETLQMAKSEMLTLEQKVKIEKGEFSPFRKY